MFRVQGIEGEEVKNRFLGRIKTTWKIPAQMKVILVLENLEAKVGEVSVQGIVGV